GRRGGAGVCNRCAGDGPAIGGAIAADRRLPLVSFTGSTRTGREVTVRVAERLGRSILELGGNNGIVVMDDANLELALAAVVFGAVGTAGPRRPRPRRPFLHSGIRSRAARARVAAYKQV